MAARLSEKTLFQFNSDQKIQVLDNSAGSWNAAVAAVAKLVERPEWRSLKEVQLSDMSSNPGSSLWQILAVAFVGRNTEMSALFGTFSSSFWLLVLVEGRD